MVSAIFLLVVAAFNAAILIRSIATATSDAAARAYLAPGEPHAWVIGGAEDAEPEEYYSGKCEAVRYEDLFDDDE